MIELMEFKHSGTKITDTEHRCSYPNGKHCFTRYNFTSIRYQAHLANCYIRWKTLA